MEVDRDATDIKVHSLAVCLTCSEIMQTSGGATALMYACQQCRENEVLEILSKQPHSVKDRDRTLKTPLHYCAENPNTSCAEVLLKVAPELVNAQDENGYCPLHLGVIAGNKALIKLLITKGADPNIHDNEGHSAVHWAIVSSEKEALEMIIRAGANPSTPDIHGGYPLHYAVQMCGSNCEYFRSFEDTIRVVESLLNVGVDVNVKDKDGRQPILWAASAGSADAVIHLVSSGACVEAADKDGLTALHCAASRGHTTTLETLISLCGANVDVIDGNGCSALFYSVTLGHADATELLLQLGAEPNRQDRKGRTPAHCGAAKGQLETLRILQKHGGNLWMRNVKGDIPLHEAVASGRKDLVIWLLSQNSEAINLANNDGRCPLHIASMYNNTEMVKVLLDSKSLVNPVMRTSKGTLMTPLNVALCKGHRSCGKYLQLHGGVPFSKVSRTEPTSVFAVRVSASEDIDDKRENLASSYSKISKSRSSSDIQGNQPKTETETTDKKKVYRRRKKKKTTSNLTTQDSDSGSDESMHELKVKIIESRKSEKSNEEDDEGNDEDEEKTTPDTKTVKKEKSPKSSSVSRKTRTTKKQESPEETFKKTESKPLRRNKSFNETKNVSDLSPEDFPLRMQVINQLDAVIMEPDVDLSKIEIESNGSRPQDVGLVEVIKDNIETQVKTAENAVEKLESAIVRTNIPNEENVKPDEQVKQEALVKTDKKEEKEEKTSRENSTKSPKSLKEETSTRKSVKSPKSSNDEGPTRKSTKSPDEKSKSSKTSHDESSVKKSLEEVKKPQETVSSKESVGVVAYQPGDKLEVEDKKTNEVEKEKLEGTENNIEMGNKTKEETPEVEKEKIEETSLSEEKLESAETQKPDLISSVEEAVRQPEKVTKNQPADEAPVIENIVKPVEKEEAKPPEVKTVADELKTIAEEDEKMPVMLEMKEESLAEVKDAKEIESEVLEEPTMVEPSESSKVFLSEISANISEPNNPVTQNPIKKQEQSPTEKQIQNQTLAPKSNPNQNVAEENVLNKEVIETESPSEDITNGSPNKKPNGLEHRNHKTPRVSRLCRRHKDFKDDANQISVTQLVQNTIRKYHMERGIFYQLLELKRYQIRSGKANEQVLVKRLADDYDRSRVFLGMKPFSGLYKFREFEKFLYDQLKALNARRSFLFPEVKSYDDIDALSGFLKKSRYKIISEISQPEMVCTCITQRCHHSACAYTSVPCSAYITDLRRHRHHKPKRESFFPRIEQPPSLKSQKFTERPATLELIQGSEKHVITLPQSSPSRGKRYYVTFTIKGAPSFKEEDFQGNSKDYFKHRHAKSV